jgi:hypothetical protein
LIGTISLILTGKRYSCVNVTKRMVLQNFLTKHCHILFFNNKSKSRFFKIFISKRTTLLMHYKPIYLHWRYAYLQIFLKKLPRNYIFPRMKICIFLLRQPQLIQTISSIFLNFSFVTLSVITYGISMSQISI